ncbi:MAG TPA: hypothetical protein VF595_12795 [Tepidisphaeraceae bacterium]
MGDQQWRDNLLAYLAVVADPQRQLAWEREERVAHVPWELVEEWFDLYHLSIELFRSQFTPEELIDLSKFDAELRSALPLPDESVATMLQSPAWQRVVLAANHPLQWTGPGVGVAPAMRPSCPPAGPDH